MEDADSISNRIHRRIHSTVVADRDSIQLNPFHNRDKSLTKVHPVIHFRYFTAFSGLCFRTSSVIVGSIRSWHRWNIHRGITLWYWKSISSSYCLWISFCSIITSNSFQCSEWSHPIFWRSNTIFLNLISERMNEWIFVWWSRHFIEIGTRNQFLHKVDSIQMRWLFHSG
jgi:hypothetical protein